MSPALLNQARQPVKAGNNAPNWHFEIAGIEFKLVSGTFNFAVDGNSGAKFVCEGEIGDLVNEFCDLYIGYGSTLVPFFRGRLMQPTRHPSGLYTEGQAQGLSSRLGTRYVHQRLTYNGQKLNAAISDLMYRAAIPDGWWEIKGGNEEIQIEDDNDILFESSYLEAMRMLMEPLGYMAIDQPGIQKLFSVRRRPGELFWASSPEGSFNESQYPRDGFEFDAGLRQYYSDVVIFRRDQDSSAGDTGEKFAVFAQRTIPYPSNIHYALAYRFKIIPDYTGTQGEADKEADEWVKYLQHAPGTFRFTCSPVDFDLFDNINVIQSVDNQPYEHSCVIKEMELRIGKKLFEMTLGGDAIRRSMGGQLSAQSLSSSIPSIQLSSAIVGSSGGSTKTYSDLF